MTDGLVVPGLPDGMCAFSGSPGQLVVVRNHELEPGDQGLGPFARRGPTDEEKSRAYDRGGKLLAAPGGTTTMVVDGATGVVVRQWLSLAGTLRNCNGGRTPWGTWLSCEESVLRAADGLERDHGWVFEVVPTNEPELQRAEPVEGMGRFNHEAAVVHAASGAVFMTEDRPDGLLYRYSPRVPGRLRAGGELMALSLPKHPGVSTGNRGDGPLFRHGESHPAAWVPLDRAYSSDDTLRLDGRGRGAVIFDGGEGMWIDGDLITVAATGGGAAGAGQLWAIDLRGPSLTLVAESSVSGCLRFPDAVVGAPWGDILVCEDADAAPRVTGVRPSGETYTFAMNATSSGEFTGLTFSPDGKLLLMNIQDPGMTIAVSGFQGSS